MIATTNACQCHLYSHYFFIIKIISVNLQRKNYRNKRQCNIETFSLLRQPTKVLHLCPGWKFTTSHHCISSQCLEDESAAWKCALYMALSPICTADKVGLIICCGCCWGCLVWGNNILARLVKCVSLQFFYSPAFSLCLRLSLHKPPHSLVSLTAFFIVAFQTLSLCLLQWL